MHDRMPMIRSTVNAITYSQFRVYHENIDCVVPQVTQKRDFKCLSFLSSFAKIINNSTPDYQCTRLWSF